MMTKFPLEHRGNARDQFEQASPRKQAGVTLATTHLHVVPAFERQPHLIKIALDGPDSGGKIVWTDQYEIELATVTQRIEDAMFVRSHPDRYLVAQT